MKKLLPLLLLLLSGSVFAQFGTGGIVNNSALNVPTGGIDASLGYVAGNDPCATILTNVTNAIAASSTNTLEIYLGPFLKYFPNGYVPCNSNPFFKLGFAGKVHFGPIQIITSQGWTTPGNNYRVSIDGVGNGDVGSTVTNGVSNIPPYGSGLIACGTDVNGWNGTNACIVNGITVPQFSTSSSLAVTFTYPHGPVIAGTYHPLIWWGGGSTSGGGTTNGGSFGSRLSEIFLDGGGANGADFNYYNTGTQESSGLLWVAQRQCAIACVFLDRAQGTSAGPSHYTIYGGEMRTDVALSNTTGPKVGYPIVGQNAFGYGVIYEGNRILVHASGGTCTQYPQGYVSVNGATNLVTPVLTYAGSCTVIPSCTIDTNDGGTLGQCSFTGGPPITALNITNAGSGYSGGDLAAEFPFQIGNITINGKGLSNLMEEGVYIEGAADPTIGPIHCEFMDNTSIGGACVHVGAGNARVTGGYVEGISLANQGNEGVHYGVGGDFNLEMLNIFGVAGSISAILDDACTPTGNPLPGPLSIYDPCSFWVPSGSGNLTAASTIAITGTSPQITTTATNQSLTLAPNGTGSVLGPAGTTTVPGFGFTSNTTTGIAACGSNILCLLSNGVTVAYVTGGIELTDVASYSFSQTGSANGTKGLTISPLGTGTTEALSVGGTSTGLLFLNECKPTSAITLTSQTTICSWTLPNVAKTWSWQCQGTYSTTTTSISFTLGMVAAQTPTSITGNGIIYSTLTGTSTAGSATVASTTATTILAGASVASATNNMPWFSSGTIQASATSGTFILYGTASTSSDVTINVGTSCNLF